MFWGLQEFRKMQINSNRGRDWGLSIMKWRRSCAISASLLFLPFLVFLLVLLLHTFQSLLFLKASFSFILSSPSSFPFSLQPPLPFLFISWFLKNLWHNDPVWRRTQIKQVSAAYSSNKIICHSWQREKERRQEAEKERERRGRLQRLGNKASVVGFTGSTGRRAQLQLLQQTTLNSSPRRCECEYTCEAFSSLHPPYFLPHKSFRTRQNIVTEASCFSFAPLCVSLCYQYLFLSDLPET